MSERLKGSEISNKNVIDDLTKDLPSHLKPAEPSEEFVINPESSAEHDLGSAGDANPRTDIPDYEFDRDEPSHADPEASDTESVDEVSLKDEEVDLTDEEKEMRRVRADAMKIGGNDAFKIGRYEESIEKYTEGLKICPLQFPQLRSVLYCNRSAAKMKMELYSKAVRDCTKSLQNDETYLKAYTRRAQCYEALEKLDECLADYKKAVELDPSHREAQRAVARLTPIVEEKNEKLKTEMLGKLKDLGNMILKPFGLSTENFQMEQDPDSKGYKINFKQ